MHLDNSFISTTLCDDLPRATEAQDGKKTHEPRFVLVPIRFAFEAWPRPGLAWPRPASPRPCRASKRLDCRLLKHATSCINIIERDRLS